MSETIENRSRRVNHSAPRLFQQHGNGYTGASNNEAEFLQWRIVRVTITFGCNLIALREQLRSNIWQWP